MNAKEKFEEIIKQIEDLACDKNKSAKEITEVVTKMTGLSYRDAVITFSFLTEELLLDYVKERKLQMAYKNLVLQEEWSIGEAIEIAGYDNQSSFSKAFQKTFGLSPKEAWKKKDLTLLSQPKKWSELEDEGQNTQRYRYVMSGVQTGDIIAKGYLPMSKEMAMNLIAKMKERAAEGFEGIDEEIEITLFEEPVSLYESELESRFDTLKRYMFPNYKWKDIPTEEELERMEYILYDTPENREMAKKKREVIG